MARLITAGFETGSTREFLSSPEATLNTLTLTNGADVTTSKSNNGDYSLACLSTQQVLVNPKTSTDGDTFFFKFDFLYIEVSGHTTREIWRDNAPSFGSHASIWMNASGQLVARGDNLVGATVSGTTVLTPDTWYEIQLRYKAGSALGHLYIDIDGNREITLNTDTKRGTAAVGNWIFGETGSGNDYYYDNIFLNDEDASTDANGTSVSVNNSFITLGTSLILLSPSGDGTLTQWTSPSGSPHYSKVNQIPVFIGDSVGTTRITSTGLNQIELFYIESASSVIGFDSQLLIRQIHVASTSQHSSTTRHKRMIDVGGTNYVSALDSRSVAGTLSLEYDIWRNNPSTSIPWIVGEIDQIQIGVKTTSVNGINPNSVGDMAVYVEYYPKLSDSLNLFIEGSIPTSGTIFISNVDSILASDLDGSNSNIIINDGDNGLEVIGCDFIDVDTINEKLFFMLLGLPSQCRMSNLDGTSLENVEIDTGESFSLIPSLSIDNSSEPVTSNDGNTITGPRVFIADHSNGRIGIGNIVKRRDLTSGDFLTSIIIDSFIDTNTSPINVKYDSENEILFWTEVNGSINKSDLDNPSEFVIEEGVNPQSFIIDPVRRKVYYIGSTFVEDQPAEGLIRTDYDGGNSSIITSTSGPINQFAGIGLDVTSNNIYILLNSVNVLYYKNVPSDSTISVILDSSDQVDDPRDVKIHLFEAASIQSSSRQKSLFVEGHIEISGIPINEIITPPPPPSPLPGVPPQDPDDTPVPTSLSLFLSVPEPLSQSMDLFIGSLQIEDYLSLYMGGPAPKTNLINLFLKVQEYSSDSKNLVVFGLDTQDAGVDLYVFGLGNITENIDLYVGGFDFIDFDADFSITGIELQNSDIELFSMGHIDLNSNITLYINTNNVSSNSFTLFINGRSQNSDDNFGIGLDILFKNSDHYPQIIGRFTTDPASVSIEVWDLMNNNSILSLSSDICYHIGDTSRWGWSTINLPPLQKTTNQFVWRMTGDTGEMFEGEFILKIIGLYRKGV